jgi:alpha-aminoadipate carrier protein LysW
MAAVECPECAGEIEVDDTVEQGEIVPCPECGADLEVLGVAPIKLGWRLKKAKTGASNHAR